MDGRPFFEQAHSPDSGIGWRLGALVGQAHPGKYVLDGATGVFDLDTFAFERQCEATLAPSFHSQLSHQWTRQHGISQSGVNAVYDVRWRGHELRVIMAEWMQGYQSKSVNLIVADTKEIARSFFEAASAYCNDPRDAVLRFSSGCWGRSHELWKIVQAASFDDLILADDLKTRIQADFKAFVAARDEYARYGVPHKRGVLLVGPPGNGKTHCLRAILKMLALPTLYVMSLKPPYGNDDDRLIESVFDRAREITPCVLVFEDLDAMVHDRNRSFFLNQLDGLSTLSGVITIATTNHPDRLDPAIVHRPSRFDRKYTFALPEIAERESYLSLWNGKAHADMQITPSELREIAEASGGFSFAYLKELYVSSMTRWIGDKKTNMATVMKGELAALREQMKSGAPAQGATAVPSDEEDDDDD